jgi:hypothetical protein
MVQETPPIVETVGSGVTLGFAALRQKEFGMRKHLVAVAAAVVALGGLASGAQAQKYKVTVDAGGGPRQSTVMSTTLGDLKLSATRFLGTLTSEDGKEKLRAQLNTLLDADGRPTGTRVEWVQPALAAGEKRNYTLTYTALAYNTVPFFHFVEADGYRDLLYGDKPVYRYINKYNPADHANTFKPFHHVYGFHGEGEITKGTGGSFPHHRGLFFGHKTEYGDFWHGKDCRQVHTGFRFETETSGPVSARSVSTIDWIDKTNAAVVRETREVAAYRASESALLLDFDITVENLTGKPLALGGDPQHAGFHFRAAQEVADAKPGAKGATTAGGATYVRPVSAKFTKNDEWLDCPWVACSFSVKGNPYTVVHMDHPENPKPATFSTRPYGRFGPYAPVTVKAGEPLKLKYRIAVLDGNAYPNLDAEAAGGWYADYVTPAAVTVSK